MPTDKQQMIHAFCRTRDPALRNALAEIYLYLARAVAARFQGRGLEMEDLVQVASVALLHALERFDCELGISFTTFAVPTIAGEVRNYLRDKANIVRLPRRGRELLPRILREREAFLKEKGREPRVAELAERLSVSEDHVLDALEMQRRVQRVSLDSAAREDTSPLDKYLGREEEGFERIDTVDMVESLLSRLEGKSRFIIEERFLRQKSQHEVARALGVSQMQVSRLERKALDSLRKPSE